MDLYVVNGRRLDGEAGLLNNTFDQHDGASMKVLCPMYHRWSDHSWALMHDTLYRS